MFQTSTKDGVITLTLSRPPVNAISEEWVRGFEAKLDEFASGPQFKVLHIRSDQKIFCAGADLKEVRARMEMTDGHERMYAYVAAIQRLYFRVEEMPQVTLAEIGGAAMGGGFELALSCDLRVAANEAKVGLPEARLGLIPGAGGTQRIIRQIPPCRAKEIMFTGEQISAEEAVAIGLANRVVPKEQVLTVAKEIAGKIATKSSLVLKLLKRTLRDGADMPLSAALPYEQAMIGLVLDTADAHEGCSAFLEKRKANFAGR